MERSGAFTPGHAYRFHESSTARRPAGSRGRAAPAETLFLLPGARFAGVQRRHVEAGFRRGGLLGQAPGVGTPEPCGLPAEPVIAGLERLVREPGLRALEITEFNPDRDRDGRTALLAARLIGTLLKT